MDKDKSFSLLPSKITKNSSFEFKLRRIKSNIGRIKQDIDIQCPMKMKSQNNSRKSSAVEKKLERRISIGTDLNQSRVLIKPNQIRPTVLNQYSKPVITYSHLRYKNSIKSTLQDGNQLSPFPEGFASKAKIQKFGHSPQRENFKKTQLMVAAQLGFLSEKPDNESMQLPRLALIK